MTVQPNLLSPRKEDFLLRLELLIFNPPFIFNGIWILNLKKNNCKQIYAKILMDYMCMIDFEFCFTCTRTTSLTLYPQSLHP